MKTIRTENQNRGDVRVSIQSEDGEFRGFWVGLEFGETIGYSDCRGLTIEEAKEVQPLLMILLQSHFKKKRGESGEKLIGIGECMRFVEDE